MPGEGRPGLRPERSASAGLGTPAQDDCPEPMAALAPAVYRGCTHQRVAASHSGVCASGKENKQAETGLKTQETINKKESMSQNLFTLKEINIWKKLLEQAAKAKGRNEFNRYPLGLLEEERSKDKLDKNGVNRRVSPSYDSLIRQKLCSAPTRCQTLC